MPTTVIRSHGPLLELNLPPVMNGGASLRIHWATRAGAGGVDGVVEKSPGTDGLCVRPGTPFAAERRALRRARPSVALAVTIQPATRPGTGVRAPARGALHDISLGGLSFLTTGTVRLGDRVGITLGHPMDAPVLADVPGRVVQVKSRPAGRRLVSCSFDDPARIGDVVLRLVA